MRAYMNVLTEQVSSRIDELAKFSAIAWDFDETLINCPASPVLWKFIEDHPEIDHTIVTFRTHGLVRAIWTDLQGQRASIGRQNFAGVLNISDEAWMAHNRCDVERRRGTLTGPLTDEEVFYREWKGWACKANGLPVLVDDKTEHVEAGCTKYGVVLFDPLVFVTA